MKINGDLIIDDTNTKLKDTVNPTFSYAQMKTSFTTKRLETEQKITDWDYNVTIGGFYCSTSNGYLLVPAGTAQVIEIKGILCGSGYCNAYFRIEYGNGAEFNWNAAGYSWQAPGILTQPQGNGYWKLPMPSITIRIPDTTKDLYIYLMVSPYNQSYFDMNAGFGAASWMSVTKLA